MNQIKDWIPCWTILHKEVHRFTSIWVQSLATPCVSALLFLWIFSVNITKEPLFGENYAQFLIPGLMAISAINGAFFNPAFSLILAKFYGDIEDLKVTPLRPRDILIGAGVAASLRGLLSALLVWLCTSTAVFLQGGTFYVPSFFVPLLFSLFILGLTFGWIGFAIGMKLRNFEMLNAWVQFIFVPLSYLGGTFFSASELSFFWKRVMSVNPLFYYISAIRFFFIGEGEISLWKITAVFSVVFAISLWIAYRAIQKESFRHL